MSYWNQLEEIARCVCEYQQIEKKDIIRPEWDRDFYKAKLLFCYSAIEITGVTIDQLANFLDWNTRRIYEVKNDAERWKELRPEIDYIKYQFTNRNFSPYAN